MKKNILLLLVVLLLSPCLKAQQNNTNNQTLPYVATQWADSVANTLTLEKKIAQLMVVRVPLDMTKKETRKFERKLSDLQLGGVCFFVGTARKQLEQTKSFQEKVDIPLFVCLDAENGLGMRLKDCYSFPCQMLMGALSLSDDYLIHEMGTEVARQCRKMGINADFAPVADLNSNSNNPVIGPRSFGMNRERAGAKGIQYFTALQGLRIMSSGKHFPGHGDTDVDSHVDLPVIKHSRKEIDSIDSYPFRQLVNKGIAGMMIGHLQVNALDSTHNMPSSLSPKIIGQPQGTPYCKTLDSIGAYQGYLRSNLGFDGIVFTDGLDMQGVAKNYTKGSAELKALQAGVDVLVLPPDVQASIDTIKAVAEQDSTFAKVIDAKCRRMLAMKYWCGLNHLNMDTLSVPTMADAQRCRQITTEMATKAATLVRNWNNVLPLQPQDSVLRLAIGYGDSTLQALDSVMIQKIEKAGKVLISYYGNTEPTSRRDYGITDKRKALVDSVCAHNNNTILVIYGSPFSLKFWPYQKEKIDQTNFTAMTKREYQVGITPRSIVIAYQNMQEIRDAVQYVITGKSPFSGTLPVSVAGYPEGYQYVPTLIREDPYGRLAAVGMDKSYFYQVDSVIQQGINAQAYPGCQVLVAKDGQVVYNRTYGRQTYNAHSPLVDTATVYDLASLTKVAATTFAIMKLVDEGKIGLNDKLSRYLPYLKHTDKSRITVRQTLSHFAGLKAFDAYWKNVDDSCMNYSLPRKDGKVLSGPCEECKAEVLKQIVDSKLEAKNKYVYSDLGFILLADLVEHVSGQSVDVFMQKHFYEPLAMTSTTFQPLLHGIDSNRIAPTEVNPDRRLRTLRGEVHDPTAAAIGGVAGNAGLFSTADDLSKLYLMLLNGGNYEGHSYLSQEVIDTFNHQYYKRKGNRRSLGYDKPQAHPHGNTAKEVSQSSFGHTGFTGTMVWVDPEYHLVYIFLSNRVNPSSKENKLADMNIRTKVQSLIYQSFLSSKK